MRWFFSNDAPIYTQLIEQIQVGIVTGVVPKESGCPRCGPWRQRPG